MERQATVRRTTRETDVSVTLSLDDWGACTVDTGIPFFDHMLTLLCRHGRLGAEIRAQGDLEVDFHHTVEDVGLCLGQALVQALGDKRGIVRYGQALVPMDEALAEVALDLSGRPYLVLNLAAPTDRVGTFDRELANTFLQALATAGGITLHVNLRAGQNLHHILEAVFKALGRALGSAVERLPGDDEVPSTKGVL